MLIKTIITVIIQIFPLLLPSYCHSAAPIITKKSKNRIANCIVGLTTAVTDHNLKAFEIQVDCAKELQAFTVLQDHIRRKRYDEARKLLRQDSSFLQDGISTSEIFDAACKAMCTLDNPKAAALLPAFKVSLERHEIYTTMESAAMHDDITGVKMLHEEFNVPVNEVNSATGTTPLMVAVREGNLNTVDYLVTHGADLSVTDKSGSSLLIIATQKGHKEIVSYLIKKKVDLFATNKHQKTAYYYAKEFQYPSIEQIIKSHIILSKKRPSNSTQEEPSPSRPQVKASDEIMQHIEPGNVQKSARKKAAEKARKERKKLAKVPSFQLKLQPTELPAKQSALLLAQQNIANESVEARAKEEQRRQREEQGIPSFITTVMERAAQHVAAEKIREEQQAQQMALRHAQELAAQQAKELLLKREREEKEICVFVQSIIQNAAQNFASAKVLEKPKTIQAIWKTKKKFTEFHPSSQYQQQIPEDLPLSPLPDEPPHPWATDFMIQEASSQYQAVLTPFPSSGPVLYGNYVPSYIYAPPHTYAPPYMSPYAAPCYVVPPYALSYYPAYAPAFYASNNELDYLASQY